VEIHVQVLHAPMVHFLFSLVVVVIIVVFKQQELEITLAPSWRVTSHGEFIVATWVSSMCFDI